MQGNEIIWRLRSSGTVESEHPYQPNEMCYYEISPNSTNVRVKFTKVSFSWIELKSVNLLEIITFFSSTNIKESRFDYKYTSIFMFRIS